MDFSDEDKTPFFLKVIVSTMFDCYLIWLVLIKSIVILS